MVSRESGQTISCKTLANSLSGCRNVQYTYSMHVKNTSGNSWQGQLFVLVLQNTWIACITHTINSLFILNFSTFVLHVLKLVHVSICTVPQQEDSTLRSSSELGVSSQHEVSPPSQQPLQTHTPPLPQSTAKWVWTTCLNCPPHPSLLHLTTTAGSYIAGTGEWVT